MDPDLVVAVAVDVEDVVRQSLPLTQRRFRLRQVPPDRVSQMRQVEAAEDAVPVGVVALGPADGATRRGRIAMPARQRAQRHHLLVHPVRFGILDQEVAPVRAANERAVGAGHTGLAEIAAPAG